MNPLDLGGRKAFVAGSSRGIGAAVADALAGLGADVFLAARDEQLLAENASSLADRHGVRASYCAADLESGSGVENAVISGLSAFGHFDILVANCGGPKPGKALEVMDDDSLGEAYERTFMSSIRLIRGIVPGMVERKWGRVVAITSVSVFEPIDNLALSNAFRTGLTAFLKSLSREVAGHGVTVNAVCPGYTRTGRLLELAGALAKREKTTVEEICSKWERSVPMGRLGEPGEVAAAVAFLASGMASYITGVSLPVDGGRLKGVFV